MPSINVTNQSGQTDSVQYQSGVSLMEALREAGYEEIEAICGGCCSCATCHIHVGLNNSVGLLEMEDDELVVLELADEFLPERSRLSCQIELSDGHDGLIVDLVKPS